MMPLRTLDGFLSLCASSMTAYCQGIWERKSWSINAMSYVVNRMSKGNNTCQNPITSHIKNRTSLKKPSLRGDKAYSVIKPTSDTGCSVACSNICLRASRLVSLSPTYWRTFKHGANLAISDTQPSVTLRGHNTTMEKHENEKTYQSKPVQKTLIHGF